MSFTFQHADDIPPQQGSPDSFTGTVYVQRVAANDDCRLGVNRVTFQNGARTFWHIHSGEQTLYFLEGRGRVQVRGSQASDATEGDVAHIPPGTEHWHGAHPEEGDLMRHLAITFGEVTWLEPVSEEEYRAGLE